MSARRIDTKDPEALSRPERAVFRNQGRAVANKVIAAGGCFYCTHRDQRTEGWGRARCGKVAPAQFLKSGCTFNPDPDRIERIQR